MSLLAQTRISVLDLSPIRAGHPIAQSYADSLALARHVDELGYTRYWLAEHHNIPGVASSATVILIGHIAGGTRRIRVGSGGIMLPNHAPLIVAEQFGTLESLYPGRIDLGLGRAPGTDGLTARALRRDLTGRPEDFPALLMELRGFLAKPESSSPRRVRAIPGEGLEVPIWLLGSSDFSARLAGKLGLPFAFAGQFAPRYMLEALAIYRRAFEPSETLRAPYAMIGTNVIAAESDDEADYLSTSAKQHVLNLIRNDMQPLAPPVDDMDALWSVHEARAVEDFLGASVIGGRETVRKGLERLIGLTGANEVMINAAIYDQDLRRRSFSIVSELKAEAAEAA
ncbi:LLM class flavin-dependent oxidoreductase [Tistrella mobilis]|uniref:LLM class flavin-dependent oxidoreductase n=1 Tax=Tistrella mobilis TaxID=171437 RepID=UPI0035581E1D